MNNVQKSKQEVYIKTVFYIFKEKEIALFSLNQIDRYEPLSLRMEQGIKHSIALNNVQHVAREMQK